MRAAGLAGICLALLATSPARAADKDCAWRPAWAAAQMVAEGDNALPKGALANATLRQIVRPTIAGTALRVRISNAFGTAPLLVAAASIARAPDNRAAAVDATSLHALRFNGARGVTIPAGAEWLSDPVALPITAFADMAVSLRLAADPPVQTAHPGSRATSWLAPGDQTDAAALTDARQTDHWFQLAALEVQTCAASPVIVVIGDSITDGRGSTTNGNDRWTDVLARRLNGKAAVLNAGLGGNRLLLDGLGPNALARLDRDLLAQPGVTHLILLEGVNDIGMLTREVPASADEHRALVERMIAGYVQIVARAHARGIRVIGATILPFMGFDYYQPDGANEADRQAVNAWLRAPGHVDALVDFDAVMRDPARPDRLRADLDSGDHIHPSPAGYRAMAEAVPLGLLKP